MRIGLNLLYLIPGRSGGTETYGRGLMRALADADAANEYFVFLNREAHAVPVPAAANFHRVDCAVPAVYRSLRYAWEQAILPRQLRRLGIDVVHSLGYVMPLYPPCAGIVTLPDLNLRAIPAYLPAAKRAVLAIPRFFSAESARRAHRVITISEFSKKEIVEGLAVPPEKVVVTHLGPPDVRLTAAVPGDVLRRTYGLPDRYIVAIGGTSRHKNIARLIAAFREIKDSYPHALVLPGHVPPDVDVPQERARPGMTGRLFCPGYVPDADLASLLAHADLFVLPSLYEGFGLPVLEAQQAGVAIACSTAGSLPEVAGDGAEYFDPYSIPSIAATMRRCLDDPVLRRDLIARGTRNVARFSWKSTAAQTLEVYRTVSRAERLAS